MKQLVNAKDYGFFLRALCLAVILIGLPPLPKIQAQSAEYSGNVVDAENQVIYKIIKDTETVVISEVQSQGSNYGKLVLPKTVTDNNTESVTYGRTFTVVAMERDAFRDCPMKEVVIEAEIPEIPESAFENCYYMETVTLPSTIRRIGLGAFRYCNALTGVTAPAVLEEIDNQAFYNCYSMTKFDLSACVSLNRIGSQAFYNCSQLVFPTFPTFPDGSVLIIGRSAFSSCYALGDVVIPNNARISQSVFSSSTIASLTFPESGSWTFGSDEDLSQPGSQAFAYATLPETVTIPACTNRLPENVFYSASGLKSLVIEDNPDLEIGTSACLYANDLTSVEFRGKVKSIGSYAFSNTYLKSIAIPECESLGNNAFASCSQLTEVIFPETEIAKIESNLFYNDYALKSVTLPGWLKSVRSGMFDSCSALKTVVFPDNLEEIGTNSFKGTALELPAQNSLPSTVTKIGSNAFAELTTLDEISLPAALETIDEKAFYRCSNLKINNFAELTALNRIGNGAFADCVSITEITFPANLKNIGVGPAYGDFDEHTLGAFANCTALKDVKFNPGVVVGVNAFRSSGISDFEWPEGMEIRQGAFSYCKSLKKVSVPGHVKELPNDAFYEAGLTEAELADGVEIVGKRTFMNCRTMILTKAKTVKEVKQGGFAATGVGSLPPNIETIGEFAFWQACFSGSLAIPSTVKTIGSYAFCDNNIWSVQYPDYAGIDIEAIRNGGPMPVALGSGVFSNNSFTSVQLPEWMVRVPNGMFRQEVDREAYRMVNNDNIVWTRKVELGNYFDKRESLESVTFAPGTVYIGHKAFLNNIKLRIGDFPSTVTYFGSSSFENCGTGLTTEAVTDADGNPVLDDDGNPVTREVFLGKLIAADDCQILDNAFANAKLEGIEFVGCATFGKDALANMKYIREIDFPACMTEIPAGFCKGWSVLERVGFKENKVIKIGKEAFMNCPLLCGELDLSGLTGLETIDDGAFSLTPVTSVKFPESEFTLGKRAFLKSNLTSVTIPKKVYNIGDLCFFGNTQLATVEFEPRDDTKQLSIGDRCFFQNTNITKIEFPECDLMIGKATFSQLHKLETVIWPSDERSVALSDSSFYWIPALKMERLHPSVKYVPKLAFAACSGLENIELPGVTIIGEQAFNGCTNLKTVKVGGYIDEIRTSAFLTCNSLQKISMPVAPRTIGLSAFKNLRVFKTFEVLDPEAQKVETVGPEAFYQCVALEDFPDIMAPGGLIRQRAFQMCMKLKSLKIPAYFDNSRYSGETAYAAKSRFQYANALQSVEFMTVSSRPILIYKDDFAENYGATPANTNMRGVSYFRGEIDDRNLRTFAFSNSNNSSYTRKNQPIKLMVDRANKYKFVEKGYEAPNAGGNKFFDIEEIKAPVMELHGEIFSTFQVGADINEYTGILRWQVELSDFDSEKPTEYELWRDGRRVARFLFDAPVLEQSGVSDGSVSTTGPTWSVTYHAYDNDGNDVTDRILYGDFYFEGSENIYTHTIQTAQTKVYFDGSSTARIGQANLGRKSWFLYKDRFDSPKLDGLGVPVSHTYVLKMKNYDYMEWENYPGLEPDADGNYYRKVAKRTGRPEEEWMVSEPCVVHTSIAHPSIAVDGLYDKAEVEADFERGLAVTTVPENATYAIRYNVPGNVVEHRLDNAYGPYIVQSTQAYRLESRDDLTADNAKWGDAAEIKGNASGVIAGPDSEVVPGKTTFQTVTDAGYRGTFGSPKVSLYGAPELQIDAYYDAKAPVHYHDGFNNMYCDYKVNLSPLLASFGYTDEFPLTSDRYFIGLWRTQTTTPIGINALADEEPEEVLVWHSDGLHPQEYMETCDLCAGAGYDPATLTFTDKVKCKDIHYNTVTYTARLYVQKPDDSSKYGVAEAVSAPVTVATLTGIESIPVDAVTDDELAEILAEGMLFDIQGIRIRQPEPGAVFIAVHDGRVKKLRMAR